MKEVEQSAVEREGELRAVTREQNRENRKVRQRVVARMGRQRMVVREIARIEIAIERGRIGNSSERYKRDW